jgi:hypothetical protein
MLIRSPETVDETSLNLRQILVDALLLDPDHIRQTQPIAVKQHIQLDVAECFMQLAVRAKQPKLVLQSLVICWLILTD